MNTRTVISILLISIILLGVLSPIPATATRVVFYGKPEVLTSQLLITQRRKIPCPDGLIRDHRNRCRRAMQFGRLKKH